MAILHVENVPEDLVRRIEQYAERARQTPAEAVIHLLEEAVPRGPAEARRRVQEVLDRIRQNLIVPPPGTPDSVELLREDRER